MFSMYWINGQNDCNGLNGNNGFNGRNDQNGCDGFDSCNGFLDNLDLPERPVVPTYKVASTL